ncbi:MAG: response regulator transcription factor, partial [Candidatus Omnitrophica bacterium]|nr:response regulator transcription factor [Candidatus Omnitrophota bacterium]
MPGYKIILADDHKILREGIKSLIEKDPSFKVVGQAQNGEELLTLLKKIRCDLIVLDLSMPQMDGIATLKKVHHQFPKIKILILTMQKDIEHFKHAMAGGAFGYLLKEDAYDQLLLAIKVALKGKRFISPTLEHFLTEQYVRSLDEGQESSPNILTKREFQILKLVAQGL